MSTNYKIGVIIDAKGASSTVADLGKIDSKLNSVGQSAKNALASFSGNLAADAVQKLTSLAIEGGAAIFQYSARMEQTRIAFGTLMGGAQAAQQHLAELQKFAMTTPFEFEPLAKMSQRLQGVGVEAGRVIPIMRDVGNIIAATGDMSAERVEGVTTALSQMIAKGKVSAEEMEQLNERNINGFGLLAEATGKSQAEVRKLAEQGAISADIMVDALQKISREKYGDAMEKQSKTFNGAMSTIKDTILQTSANAFQPWFDEISKFTVRLSEEIQKNGGDLEALGATIANYIGQGLGAALPAIAAAQGKNVVNVFKKTFTGEWSGFGFYGVDFLKGLGESLFGSSKLVEARSVIQDINKSVQQTPNLAEKLQAGQAKKHFEELNRTIYDLTNKIINFGEQTEVSALKQKLLTQNIDLNTPLAKNAIALAGQIDRMKEWKKESETLHGVISDLTLQIAFFGQESEVAATKQRLMSQGVYDFDSALAKNAVSLARQLDGLKASKKAQDEYNNQLKTAREHLQETRKNALFEIQFPNATELDKFNVWVRSQAENFRELKGEIEATRAALEISAFMAGFNKKMDLVKQGLTGIDEKIKSITETTKDGFGETVGDFAKLLGLSGVKDEFGVDFTAEKFIDESRKYAAAYRNFTENTNTETGEALEKAAKEYRNFLQTFYLNTEGGKIRFFGDQGQIDDFVRKIGRLGVVVTQSDLKQGLTDLDKVLEDLGLNIGAFGAQNEIEKFNELLANPEMTAAIAKRAAAIGLTAEAFAELLRKQKAAEVFQNLFPKPEGEEDEAGGQNPFLEGLLGRGAAERITSEAEYIKSVYKDLGATAGDVINTMVQGGASLLEQWIATGEISGQAIRQMTASIIAGLVAQSAVKAIFELAEGFAATAQHRYKDAAAHFAAAKIYGTVAAVSAAAGIGLGAALGKPKRGGSDAQNQPDYVTAGSNSSPNYLQSSNQNFGVSGRSQQNGNAEIVAEIRALNEKLVSVPADHILKVAAKRNGPFITDIMIESLKRNGSQASAAGKALRLG